MILHASYFLPVALVLSGVDCNHPALGGSFGPGHKFAGGYDFVGDFYNGENQPTPDTDPHDVLSIP